MAKSEWTNVAIGAAALLANILGGYAVYLSLDKAARGELMLASAVVINVLTVAFLIVAITLNLRDAHRAKSKQAVIESLGAECELQKAVAKRRLEALMAAARDLRTAGQLNMLADEALRISNQLAQILSENATDPNALDLAQPLSRAVAFLELGERVVLPWQRLRLMSLRDRYSVHRDHVMAIPGLESEVRAKPAPLEMTVSQIQAMLSQHRMALIGKEEALANPYTAALRLELGL